MTCMGRLMSGVESQRKQPFLVATFQNVLLATACSCLCGVSVPISEVAEIHGVLAGLEVRVAFGEVWKESLTELSGGQRSLLALSLILALLLFKPAPLYILDEVGFCA